MKYVTVEDSARMESLSWSAVGPFDGMWRSYPQMQPVVAACTRDKAARRIVTNCHYDIGNHQ